MMQNMFENYKPWNEELGVLLLNALEPKTDPPLADPNLIN